MKKRILATLLVLAMLFSVLPAQSIAASADPHAGHNHGNTMTFNSDNVNELNEYLRQQAAANGGNNKRQENTPAERTENVPEERVSVNCSGFTTLSDANYFGNSGNYKLGGDYTRPSGSFYIPGGVSITICLHGHKLTATSIIQLEAGASLTICDCTDSGSMTVNEGCYINSLGTVNLYGGDITILGSYRGILNGIQNGLSVAVLNIHGASVAAPNATNSCIFNGPAATVNVNSGTVLASGVNESAIYSADGYQYIYGGYVGDPDMNLSAIICESNEAYNTFIEGGTVQGKIALQGLSGYQITGGEIIGGEYGVQIVSKTVAIKGDHVISGDQSDFYLQNGKVEILPGFDPNGATYEVLTYTQPTTAAPYVQITKNWGANKGNAPVSTFESADKKYEVVERTENGATELYLAIRSYKVKFEYETNAFTVNISSTSYQPGAWVQFDVFPKTGFEIDTVTATYTEGGTSKTVTLNETIGTAGVTYSFVGGMPAADVTVTITYKAKHNHVMTPGGGNVIFGNELGSDFAGGYLSAGNYVLTDNITVTESITTDEVVNLCLNGKTLSLDENRIEVYGSGTLNLCDCGNGEITSSHAVCAFYNMGTTNFYSGAINHTRMYATAAVYNSGSFNLYSGTISSAGNYGIHHEGTALSMQGNPTITGATAGINLNAGKLITVAGTITPPEGPYTVYVCTPPAAGSPTQFTSGWSSSQQSGIPFVSSPKQGYGIKAANGELWMALSVAHEHYMAVDTVNGGEQADGTEAVLVDFENALDSTFTGGALSGGNYVLSENITTNSNITISGNVDICLNGYILDVGAGQVNVAPDAVVKICDCNSSGNGQGKITSSFDGSTLHVPANGVLYLYGGTVENTRTEQGTATNYCAIYSKGTTHIVGGKLVGQKIGLFITEGETYISGGMIEASTYGVCMNGENAQVTTTGGEVSGSAIGINNIGGTVTVSGGEVTGTTQFGIMNGGTLTISNGTVSGGTINGARAAVYNNGTTYVHDGTLTGTRSGIENYSGSVIFTNGTIQAGSYGILLLNGEAAVSGGSIKHMTDNVFVGIRVGDIDGTMPAKLTMTGGSILSTSRGIEITSGEVTISDCNIHSTNNSAISLVNGTLTVTGGTFAGDKHAGIYVENGTFNLKGAPVLSGGEAQIKLSGDFGAKITMIGKLTGENPSYSVMRTGMGGIISEDNPIQFTNNWREIYKDDVASYPFYHYKHQYGVEECVTEEGKIELHFVVYHKHTMSTDCHVDPEVDENGMAILNENIFFNKKIDSLVALKALDTDMNPDNGIQLPEGDYVLTESFACNMPIYVTGDVNLCLKGNTLNMEENSQIIVSSTGTLNICDCGTQGAISSDNTTTTLYNLGTTNLYSGTLSNANTFAATVFNNGSMNIHGGTVAATWYAVDNRPVDGTIPAGSLTVRGGTLTSSSTFAVNHTGTSFSMIGSPEIDGFGIDIYLPEGKLINILGKLAPTGGETYIVRTENAPTPNGYELFTANWTTNGGTNLSAFASWNAEYMIVLQNGELYLHAPLSHMHYMAADVVNGMPNDNGGNDAVMVSFDRAIASADDLSDYAPTGELQAGNYVLTDNVTIGSGITITGEGNVVNLCLNGHTLELTNSIIIKNSAVLNLCDCNGDADGATNEIGTIQLAENASSTSYILLNQSANVNVYGGRISNVHGKAIEMEPASANSTIIPITRIYGGEMVGKGTGGVVSMENNDSNSANTGELYIEDGRITNTDTIPSASGLTIKRNNNVFVRGGKITADYGIVNHSGNVTITGGEITGTTMGINNNGGTVNISGGKVTGNNAYGIMNAGTGTISGGYVSGNVLGIDNSGTLNVTGGTIECKTQAAGGNNAVIKHNGTKFNLEGSPSLVGGNAHILLGQNKRITVTGQITPPDDVLTYGKVYHVRTTPQFANQTSAPTIQITENWYQYNTGSIPFRSVDGNTIGELNTSSIPAGNTANDELYFYIAMYSVTVANSANGTVTANTVNAYNNTEIILTITPDDGYILDEITVTGADGTDIELTTDGNNYKFLMPAQNVTVQAVFSKTHIHRMSVNCETTGDDQIAFDQVLKSSFSGGTLSQGSYVLNASIALTANIEIPADATVNLCLYGKNINAGEYCINVAEGGVLNICDCSKTANEALGSSEIYTSAEHTIQNKGSLNLYGGTVRSDSALHYTVNNIGGNVAVHGGKVDAPYTVAIFNQNENNDAANVTVNGGEVIGKEAGIQAIETCTGNITVNGGKIHSYALTDLTADEANTYGIFNQGSGNVTVTGGTITSGTATGVNNNAYGICNIGTGDVSVSGGSISCGNVSGNYSIGYGIYNGAVSGNVTVTAGTITTGTVSGNNIPGVPENERDDDAFVYGVYNGSTSENKVTTISGGTISSGAIDSYNGAASVGVNSYGVFNEGTLQINAGANITGVNRGISNVGTANVAGGEITATAAEGKGIYNAGTLTATAGTITCTATDGEGITNFGTATLSPEENDDLIVTGNRSGIYNEAYGVFTVNGGTISGTDAERSSGIGNTGNGFVTVNGGIITGVSHGAYNEVSGHIEINGGDIKATSASGLGLGNDHAATVTITGGDLYGAMHGIYNNSSVKYDEENNRSAILINGNGTPNIIGGYAGISSGNGTVVIDNENAFVKGAGIGVYNGVNSEVIMHAGEVTTNNVGGSLYGMQNLGLATVDGGRIHIEMNDSYGINNTGTLYVSGTALIEGREAGNNIGNGIGNGIGNFGDGQATISGGTIIGTSYGVYTTDRADTFITDDDANDEIIATITGENQYGLFINTTETDRTAWAHVTMDAGKVYGTVNGVTLQTGTFTITGGEVKGENFGVYMANEDVDNDGDTEYGIFELGKEPAIIGTDETVKDNTGNIYADIWFDFDCRVTIIDEIKIPHANVPWSILTADQPTLNEPLPFTHDWTKTAVAKENKDKDDKYMMVGEEKEFRHNFFTNLYYDVQLYDADGDEMPEVNLAYSEEYLFSTVTFYQWKDHGIKVSTEQLAGAIARQADRSESLMYNRASTALNVNSIKSWYLCLADGTMHQGDINRLYGDQMYRVSGNESTFTDDVLWINFEDTGYVTGHIIVSYTDTDAGEGYGEAIVPVVINVYDVKDNAYVLDYGLKVDLNKDNALYANDTVSLAANNDTSIVEAFSTILPTYDGDSSNNLNFVPTADGKGGYGTFTAENQGQSAVYTLTSFMEGAESMYTAVRVHDSQATPSAVATTDPTKEVEMFKMVTVVPATVVYYEDDFAALDWNDEGVNEIEHFGNSSNLYQDVDQSEEYGKDSNYTYLEGEYSGNSIHVITIRGCNCTREQKEFHTCNDLLTFDFVGTGFDIVGRTTYNSGLLFLQVYGVNADNSIGSLIKSQALDTIYNVDNGEIYEVPILHVENLTHAKYRVKLITVPKYSFAGGTPELKESYLYIDGIRIYNPLSADDPMQGYYGYGEKGATIKQVRQLLLNGQAAAASVANGEFSFGSGLVSFVEDTKESQGFNYTGNNVTSLNDYIGGGPNNEVYLNSATQSLVLYVKETGETPMIQLAVRNLNPTAFADGNNNTPGLALMIVDAENSTAEKIAYKSLNIVDPSKAISYAEQYYTINYKDCPTEEIAGETYYRVVLSSLNESAFCLTNLKYNDVAFYTIPGSSASYRYDENGIMIDTTAEDGTVMPNLQLLAWQLDAMAGMLPGDDSVETDDALKFKRATLTLESDIAMNFYVLESVLEGYTDPYVVFAKDVYDANGNTTKITKEVRAYTESTADGAKCYVFTFDNISAMEMNNAVTATLFATKEGEDTPTEGRKVNYSVATYAYNMLGKTTDDSLKTLLVDMLNYGAEAQTYFGYNTQNLVNANLTEEQKAYATANAPAVSSHTSQFDKKEVTFKTATLSLEERVELNYYMSIPSGMDVSKLYLSVNYKNAADVPVTVKIPGTDFVEKMYTDGEEYWVATMDALNATDMRALCSAAVYQIVEETETGSEADLRVSSILSYSIETYASNWYDSTYTYTNGGTELGALVQDMMKFGDSTYAYFVPSEEAKIAGSFIQPWMCRLWDQQRWNQEFAYMSQLGMDYLIVQNVINWTMNLPEGTDPQAWNRYENKPFDEGNPALYSLYPSDITFNGEKPHCNSDQVEMMLKAARGHGMKIYFGLHGDDRWFKYDVPVLNKDNTGKTYFEGWSNENAALQVAVMEEIMAKYGTEYGNQIAGWYYHNEISNADGRMNAENLELYTDVLASNLNTVIAAAEETGRPLMLSPFFNITYTYGSAESYGNWWKTMFQKVNFRSGDIFAPQDTVGLDGDIDTRINVWMAELAEAANTEAGLNYWSNNESFRQTGVDADGNAITVAAPVDDFMAQVQASEELTKTHIMFSWNHYYSPVTNPTNQIYHDALLAYLKN